MKDDLEHVSAAISDPKAFPPTVTPTRPIPEPEVLAPLEPLPTRDVERADPRVVDLTYVANTYQTVEIGPDGMIVRRATLVEIRESRGAPVKIPESRSPLAIETPRVAPERHPSGRYSMRRIVATAATVTALLTVAMFRPGALAEAALFLTALLRLVTLKR